MLNHFATTPAPVSPFSDVITFPGSSGHPVAFSPVILVNQGVKNTGQPKPAKEQGKKPIK
jgi:hypothetical protein